MSGKFWNLGPMVVTGCTKCSPGCANCWSEQAHAMRQSNLDVAHIFSPHLMTDGKFNGEVQFNLHLLEKAVKTRKPQVIAIWNDLYHEGITLEQITDAHCIMAAHPRHTFLIVTKRPERAAGYCKGVHDMTGATLPSHIWHIATMENQEMVEKRIFHLLNIPGKRGIIIEPMLGPVFIDGEISYIYYKCEGCGMEWGSLMDEPPCNCPEVDFEYPDKKIVDVEEPLIHQVILGGETGSNARPMHPDWVRSVRDQCQAAGVPFYFKSWGEWTPYNFPPSQWGPNTLRHTHEDGQDMAKVGQKLAGRTLDGREHNDLAWVTP